jgi:hypothetical protein
VASVCLGGFLPPLDDADARRRFLLLFDIIYNILFAFTAPLALRPWYILPGRRGPRLVGGKLLVPVGRLAARSRRAMGEVVRGLRGRGRFVLYGS